MLEFFVGELLGASPISRTEKYYSYDDHVRVFCRKVLSRCTENFVGNPSVLTFRKFMVAKTSLISSGRQYQYFRSKTFRLTLPETSIVEPFSVLLISGIE